MNHCAHCNILGELIFIFFLRDFTIENHREYLLMVLCTLLHLSWLYFRCTHISISIEIIILRTNCVYIVLTICDYTTTITTTKFSSAKRLIVNKLFMLNSTIGGNEMENNNAYFTYVLSYAIAILLVCKLLYNNAQIIFFC